MKNYLRILTADLVRIIIMAVYTFAAINKETLESGLICFFVGWIIFVVLTIWRYNISGCAEVEED